MFDTIHQLRMARRRLRDDNRLRRLHRALVAFARDCVDARRFDSIGGYSPLFYRRSIRGRRFLHRLGSQEIQPMG